MYQNQSGRSMVEMLGVLAIVGVLSIGGIMGYSYAMAKHKANYLLNELNLRSIIISQQRLKGLNGSLSEFKETTNYPITLGNFAPNSANYFTLQATGIEKKVCEQLMVHPTRSISGIYQNNARLTNVDDCLDNTTLTFVYNNNLLIDNNFATNSGYDCTDMCPVGSVNPTCSSTQKQKDTGKTVCGKICALCLDDTCPTGTKKSCGSGYEAHYAGKTEYGTQCYTCVEKEPDPTMHI